MQPLLMSYLVLQRGMKPPAAGFLLTAEMGAAALASVAVARLVQRSHAQAVALWGVALAVVASLITLYLDRYGALLVARIAVGLTTGMTIMVANVVAANFADPDRYFAQIACSNLAFGIVIVGLAPHMASPYGAIFLALLLLVPLMMLMPKFSVPRRTGNARQALQEKSSPQAGGTYTLLLVGITFIINVSSGTLWGLYGLIGERSALSSEVVNSAITISVGAGAVGAASAAIVGSRFGRVGPFCLALFLMAAAILVLTSHPSAAAFRVAVCANVAAIYVILPYLGGMAIALEPHGKAATYVSSAFFGAMAMSPFIGGMLVSTVALESVCRVILVLSLGSAIIYIYIARAVAARPSAQIMMVRAD